MKYLKKALLLLLVAALLLPVLVGCGKNEKDPTEGDKVVHMPTTEPEPFVLPDREVTVGTLSRDAYTNDYLQYVFQYDEKWAVTPAERLQYLPEQLEQVLANPQDTSLQQIHDLKAEAPTQRMTVNVEYQLMNDYDRRRYAVMSEEEIIDLLVEQKDSLISMYATEKFQVDSVEKVTVTFAGQERFGLLLTGKKNGQDHFVLNLYDYKVGRYNVTTSLACSVENRTEQMLAMFEAVK